jgi:hypothetical protein
VLYWTSLAVASWVWSIILEDNRFKPHSTGFRKFFLLLFLLFFATIGFTIRNATVFMSTAELAGVPVPSMGEKVSSLKDQRHEIIAALDFLFTGF